MPYLYLTTALLSVALLPELLQETALDIGTSSVIDFGGVLLAIIGSVSVGLLVTVLFLMILAVLYTFDVYPMVAAYVQRKYADYKADKRRIHVLRGQFYEEDTHSEGGFASLDKEEKEMEVATKPVLQVKPALAPPVESASGRSSKRRASVFVAQTHSVKLHSGKERTVALRTTRFKPFQDITGMNKRFKIEQLPDADLIKQFEQAVDSDDSSSDSSSEESGPEPGSLAGSAVSGSVQASVASSNILFRLVGFAKSLQPVRSASVAPGDSSVPGRESPAPAWETLDDCEEEEDGHHSSFGVSEKSDPSVKIAGGAENLVPDAAPDQGKAADAPLQVDTHETADNRADGIKYADPSQRQAAPISAGAPTQCSGSYFVFQDDDDASVNTLRSRQSASPFPQRHEFTPHRLPQSIGAESFVAPIISPTWKQATAISPTDRASAPSPALSEVSLQSGFTEQSGIPGRRRPLRRGARERVRHSGVQGSPELLRTRQAQIQARAADIDELQQQERHYSSHTAAGPGGAAQVLLLRTAQPFASPSQSPTRSVPSPLRLSPMRVAYGESTPSRSGHMPQLLRTDQRPRGPGASGPGASGPGMADQADRYSDSLLFM
jgi:hypothetical protein